MRTNAYEKPQIKYVSLQNEAKIANTCWGYHGSDKTLYFDQAGFYGFISFQIGGTSCAMDLINVVYHWKDENGEHLRTIGPGDTEYETMKTALINSGGAEGNPFKGEGSIVFDDPTKVS